MFPPGFLGTRADLLTDLITVGYGVIPLVLYLSARRARHGDHRLHRAVQCGCLAALTVILLLFETNIRMRGGSDALFLSSSFAATPLLRGTLLVHLAIAVSTYLGWIGLTVISLRRFTVSSPSKNRRESENEDSGARARRETGSKVGTFVEDFATQPWRLKTVCSPRPVFQRAVSLPGSFSATHRRVGRWIIAGNVATAVTGVWLYLLGFVF